MILTTRQQLDSIYRKYNKFEYIHPDPLEFVNTQASVKNREITGLIAAGLAYGKVSQILKSVSTVLEIMKHKPYGYVTRSSKRQVISDFSSFKYRFTTGSNMTALILGMRSIIKRYGSLEECFLAGHSKTDETVVPAMTFFTEELCRKQDPGYLTTNPAKGSACKRLNLYLRWMIRRDKVDPGGWTRISPEKLIVPIDTHMHKIGTMLGFTSRKQANLKTALEITHGFRKINPEDPVKYDFSLTRFGIREELEMENLRKTLDSGNSKKGGKT